MITHVIVKLDVPIEEKYWQDDDIFSNEYYGLGKPLIWCKDCKFWKFYDPVKANVCKRRYDQHYWQSHEDDYCSRGERKENE